jgi:hypothetical protein
MPDCSAAAGGRLLSDVPGPIENGDRDSCNFVPVFLNLSGAAAESSLAGLLVECPRGNWCMEQSYVKIVTFCRLLWDSRIQDSSGGSVTAHGVGERGSILSRDRAFLFSATSDRLWDRLSFCPVGTWGSFPDSKPVGAWTWPLTFI